MIYRALKCSVKGWELPPITVWFQVDDVMLAEASTKLRKLLSLAWDVAEADLCIHDLCSERELEAHSRLPAAAGSARWFEWGNYGEIPLFGFTEDMVLLDGEHRKAWIEAREKAGTWARKMRMELTGKLQRAEEGAEERAAIAYYIGYLNAFIATTEACEEQPEPLPYGSCVEFASGARSE